MNVTCGCDCTYDTKHMEVTVTSKPAMSDSSVEEAFCAKCNEPQNVGPMVVCDLWVCSLVASFRGCGLNLSGLEWVSLVGSCIYSNGSSGSIKGQKCCWLAEGMRGLSVRTVFSPCVALQRSRRDVPMMGTFAIQSCHSLYTSVQKSDVISSKPSC